MAERIIGDWLDFYNTQRPHSSFDGRTSQEACNGVDLVDMMDKPDGLPTFSLGRQKQDLNEGVLATLRIPECSAT